MTGPPGTPLSEHLAGAAAAEARASLAEARGKPGPQVHWPGTWQDPMSLESLLRPGANLAGCAAATGTHWQLSCFMQALAASSLMRRTSGGPAGRCAGLLMQMATALTGTY